MSELLTELEAQLRGGRSRLAEILDVLAEAVTVRDAHDRIVFANRAALDHMGFASLEEMQSRPPRSIIKDYLVTDEHGHEVRMEDIPSVRLFAGLPADPLVIRTVHRETGELSWNLLKASALRDEAGELAATVMIIEDITREKQAELRDRFLARATETLMTSLDYEETLRNVAWLVVPEMADWCSVDLIGPTGKRQHVVVAHRDPSKLELAQKLRAYEPTTEDAERGFWRVTRTAQSELHAEVADEVLVRTAHSEEHLALLRAVGLRSAVIVPLRARDRTLGAMTLINSENPRRFDRADLEFAEGLAARAALAVENARLATARREIAATLQRSLLPETVPHIPGWEVATLYRAARGSDEVEVGGDFFDFVETPSGWLVLLGDVTGKGVEAATMTSLVRHGVRFLAKHEQSPSRILSHLNTALREQPGMWLCSALCVSLLADRTVVSSAGHPPPLLVRSDGRVREIGATGPILGAWSEGVFDERTISIEPQETLFLYTDGVTDTRGRTERFGTARLRRVLAEHGRAEPADLLVGIEEALDRFQDEIQADDTAAVALRPAGEAQATPSVVADMRTLRA